jgi:hypothetical protein
VPEILWANASEDLGLEAQIKLGFLGVGRRVQISAACRKHGTDISDPYIGCEQCAEERPGLTDLFGGGND